MFSKISLKAYVYDIIGVFCFPDEEVKGIYAKNYIIKCFLYLILTDTDNCSVKFVFVSDLKSKITEKETRNLIFQILLQSKVGPRLDKSDDFYKKFDFCNKKKNKQVVLYEVESINNPNIVTIAVNPKEYFEVFRNKKLIKSTKASKKTTQGMDFESYAARIMYLREYDQSSKSPKKLNQKRFQLKTTQMQMVSIRKAQFAGLNDKRYYFSDGITSFPYGHFLLAELRSQKKEHKEIHKEVQIT